MAITIKLPKDGKYSAKLEDNGRVAQTYTEERHVKADAGETVAEILSAIFVAFPIGSFSPISNNMLLRDVDLTQLMTRAEYRTFPITLNWNNEPFDEDEREDNPLARPFKWTSRGQGRAVARDKDRNGDAILTSAGLPPTTLPETEVYDGVLTIEGNVAAYSEATAALYRGKLNSATFLGYPPRSVKCLNVSGEGPLVENEVTFYKLTIEVAHRPGGWDFQRLDADVYETASTEAGGVPRRIEFNGEQITDPWPLDGAGGVVPKASLPGGAYYFTDELDDEIDLTGLMS
ncbi:hypothetical protein [Alienimonas sp. DA493]|uniref:hypothetical protein n=1 Tax=Alienimonas sp. DA493 TaxID=3373605 RepID=UPI003754BC26